MHEAMATDPSVMVDMMKKNLTGMVPQVGSHSLTLFSQARCNTAIPPPCWLPLCAAGHGHGGELLLQRLCAGQGAVRAEPPLQAHATGAAAALLCLLWLLHHRSVAAYVTGPPTPCPPHAPPRREALSLPA